MENFIKYKMLDVWLPRNDTVEVLIWRYLAELKICNTDIPHSPCLCQPDKKILEATFVLPLQALALRPYDLKVSLHHIYIHIYVNCSRLVRVIQGGRTWQAFGGGKNGHETFR